jgi:hypothetical protein
LFWGHPNRYTNRKEMRNYVIVIRVQTRVSTEVTFEIPRNTELYAEVNSIPRNSAEVQSA